MNDDDHSYRDYDYHLGWSDQDREHVGLCTEFPSLSCLDADPGKALEGIIECVRSAVADMRANGERLPRPVSSASSRTTPGATS